MFQPPSCSDGRWCSKALSGVSSCVALLLALALMAAPSAGADDTQPATLLWSTNFETGDYSAFTGNFYDNDSSECNTAQIDTDRSVSPTRSSRSRISCAKPDSSHRGYGGVQFRGDTPMESYTNSGSGIDAPNGVVSTWWVWLDTPYDFENGRWFSWFTANGACNYGETVITLGLSDATRQVRSGHIPGTGGQITYAPNAPTYPLRTWARFTVYLNYYEGVMRVWMNAQKVFDATFSRPSRQICQWHWGNYASAGNSDITLYEDDMSIWKLTAPLSDTTGEPWLGNTVSPSPGPGGDPRDTSAPLISGLALTNRAFRVGRGGAAARPPREVPRGTNFGFGLSETAEVAFTIERRTFGRRVGKRCKRATRQNRSGRRCVRCLRVGRFTEAGKAGPNSVRFSGRVRRDGRGRPLRPGRYRASLVATDAASNRSKAARISFRIVR